MDAEGDAPCDEYLSTGEEGGRLCARCGWPPQFHSSLNGDAPQLDWDDTEPLDEGMRSMPPALPSRNSSAAPLSSASASSRTSALAPRTRLRSPSASAGSSSSSSSSAASNRVSVWGVKPSSAVRTSSSHTALPHSSRDTSPVTSPRDDRSDRSVSPNTSPRQNATPTRVASGMWGAKPSVEARFARNSQAAKSSPVLSKASSQPSMKTESPVHERVALTQSAKTSKSETAMAANARLPKEAAGLLRRVLRTETKMFDGSEYEGCFTGADVVAALMQHRKWSKTEAVEMGRILLHSGYIARIGVAHSGFQDNTECLLMFVVHPDLPKRGSVSMEHTTLKGNLRSDHWSSGGSGGGSGSGGGIRSSAMLQPLQSTREEPPSHPPLPPAFETSFKASDIRGMTALVIGTTYRYDYKLQAPYVVYFIHVRFADQKYTISRRFVDVLELHKMLSKRYATRILPPVPKQDKKSEEENRAALQTYLTALIDCRFLGEEVDFVRFFCDFSGDSYPLLVHRTEIVPLPEAFLLLGPTFTSDEARAQAVAALRKEDTQSLIRYILFLVAALRYEPNPQRSPLLEFLLETAAHSEEFATLLFWHIIVEDEEKSPQNSLIYVLARALIAKKVSPELYTMLEQQQVLVKKLADTVSAVANSKRDRPAKIERLREILNGSFGESLRVINPPIIFPLSPELLTSGIEASTATLYKSALLPLGLEWRVSQSEAQSWTTDKNIVERNGQLIKNVIFKSGDDLRQDQLVTAFISLIAELLSTSGLDLRLCTYRVLATGRTQGLIEVVPDAHNVSSVLEDFPTGGIQMFLMQHNRQVTSHQDAVENFIRSCAGYSVVTFFLGVGDRHLDNILLTKDGRLFHVDFGFILGRDPKPLPPAVRLTQEMIEGFGGIDSNGYEMFLDHCTSAYRILRQYAPLLLGVFGLVCEAGLPGVENSQQGLSFLYQRLRLDLDDDQASEFLKRTIDESAKLLFPQLMEQLHKTVQKKRK